MTVRMQDSLLQLGLHNTDVVRLEHDVGASLDDCYGRASCDGLDDVVCHADVAWVLLGETILSDVSSHSEAWCRFEAKCVLEVVIQMGMK